MNLYQASSKFKALMIKCEEYAKENDGVIEDLMLAEIENAEASVEEAISDCLIMAKNEQIFQLSAKNEIERLSVMLKRSQIRHESMINLAVSCGAKPCKTAQYELKLSKSEAVIIDDESKLSVLLITKKTTTAPNKAAIKKAIKAGEEIEGAHIEKREVFKMPPLKNISL